MEFETNITDEKLNTIKYNTKLLLFLCVNAHACCLCACINVSNKKNQCAVYTFEYNLFFFQSNEPR